MSLSIVPRRFYATREGNKVCIYRTDGCAPHVIHGAILFKRGWEVRSWSIDGKIFLETESDNDIVRTWEERKVKLSLDPECSKGMSKEIFEDCLGKKWLVHPDDIKTRVKFKLWDDEAEELTFIGINTSCKKVEGCKISDGWMTVQRAKE